MMFLDDVSDICLVLHKHENVYLKWHIIPLGWALLYIVPNIYKKYAGMSHTLLIIEMNLYATPYASNHE